MFFGLFNLHLSQPAILSADYDDSRRPLFWVRTMKIFFCVYFWAQTTRIAAELYFERELWRYALTSLVSAEYEDSRQPLFWARTMKIAAVHYCERELWK